MLSLFVLLNTHTHDAFFSTRLKSIEAKKCVESFFGFICVERKRGELRGAENVGEREGKGEGEQEQEQAEESRGEEGVGNAPRYRCKRSEREGGKARLCKQKESEKIEKGGLEQ